MSVSARPTVVFLDRDGTIIHDVEYLSNPDDVQLLAGAAPAIALLNEARIPVIVATNQSGIARGLLTVETYMQGQQRLDELLARAGATIDASYYCPHLPDVTGPCDCRKPGVGMFVRAARELSLDMSRPAFIGDRWRDVAPAAAFGGAARLVASSSTPPEDLARAREAHIPVLESLADAITSLLAVP